MSKNILSILAILIGLIVVLGIFYFIEKIVEKPEPEPGLSIEERVVEVPILKLDPGQELEEGRPSKVFKISGGQDIEPRFFKEVVFKPYEVTCGDEQVFSIWIEDKTGIVKVRAEIETDLKIKFADLELIKGDIKQGLWQGKWQVCNILEKEYYRIIFRAASLEGNENIFTTFFRNIEYER